MNYQNHTYNCIKSNKISRKNLTKEVKDLYTEFYKKLMKENEQDTNKLKDIFYAHVLKDSILLKCLYYPKWYIDSMQSYQNVNGIFHRNWTNNPKKHRLWIAKAILKKNKATGIMLSNFKLCYMARIIKTVWFWCKNRHVDQWNRIEKSEINLSIYSQFLLKEPRLYNGEKGIFNKWCWENWTAACKKVKLDQYHASDTKINSQWIKYFNVRLETIKLLEENIGGKLLDSGLGNEF